MNTDTDDLQCYHSMSEVQLCMFAKIVDLSIKRALSLFVRGSRLINLLRPLPKWIRSKMLVVNFVLGCGGLFLNTSLLPSGFV